MKVQVFTEALRLKQVGFVHPDVATPGQEVGRVVTGKEGTWRGVPLTCNCPGGKKLQPEKLDVSNTQRTVSNQQNKERPCFIDSDLQSRFHLTHLAESRRADLGDFVLQDSDESAELHAVIQLLHEELSLHLLSCRNKSLNQQCWSRERRAGV